MSPHSKTRLAGLVAVLALTAAACGGNETPAPSITSFEADAASVEVGASVTLSWQTEHAQAIAITYGNSRSVDVAALAVAADMATVTLDAPGEVRFTLTATGAEGTSAATATATVTVVEAPVPTVDAFTASPGMVREGQPVTLAWETTNADHVVLTDPSGTAVPGADAADGSVVVSPTSDATYTLTATGRGGETSATASVTVQHAPTIDRLVAVRDGAPLNEPVVPGTEVVLEWETSHANEVLLVDSHDTPLAASTVDGSVTVSPEVSTTYSLTATGPAGEVSDTVTVEVLASVNSFTIAPSSDGQSAVVRAGDDVTLTWSTQGATSMTLTGPDGFSHTVTDPSEMASGSLTTSVAASGSFILELQPAGTFSSALVAVDVTAAPRVRTIAVSPATATAGEDVEVSWTADGAERVTLTASHPTAGDIEADTSGVEASGDTLAVTLPMPGAWTLTLVAANDVTTDTHSRTVDAEAIPAPSVAAFTAEPLRTPAGGDVTLAWDTVHADSVRLERDGVDVGAFPGDRLSGTWTDVLTADSRYVLVAVNALGAETRSAPVDVTAGAPEVVSFTSSLDFAPTSEDVTLSWEVLGGRTLTVTQDGVELCSAVGRTAIEAGACTIQTPPSTGRYTYTLTLDDNGTSATAQLAIEVTDGPIIRRFEASSPIVTVGSDFTLYASVDADAAGKAPTFTLVDQAGEAYDVVTSTLEGFDYEASVQLDAPGAYTFTLTAHTEGTTDAVAHLPLEVTAMPEVLSFAPDFAVLDSEAGPSVATLSWSTSSAVRVALWELDDALQPVGEALVDTREVDRVVAGSHDVSPTTSTSYLLEAYNAAGSRQTATLRIGVDVPLIVRFDATTVAGTTGTTVDAIAGDDVDLTWSVSRADELRLSPYQLEPVEVLSNVYTDISTSPTAQEITFSDDDKGDALVEFPAGFSFFFYGQRFTSAKVTNNGYLTFDLTAAVDQYENHLPYSGSPAGLVAPFWDDLTTENHGTAWWDTGSDTRGNYLVVEWQDLEFDNSLPGEASLSFQARLYENGDIQFLYGTMTAAKRQEYADGRFAAIGFESPDETDGLEFSYQTARPGGLSNTGYHFAFVPLTSEQTLAVRPEWPQGTYTLTATNANGVDEAEVLVNVWDDLASDAAVRFAPDAFQYQVGDTFGLTWFVEDATHAEVRLDGEVVPGCTSDLTATYEPDARDIGGSCTFTPTAAGPHGFELHYTNPVSSGVASLPLTVREPLSVDAFTVNGSTDPVFVTAGSDLTIAWSVSGASGFYLVDEATGEDLTPENWQSTDSITVPATANARFALYVSDSATFESPRMAYAAVDVVLADVEISAFAVSTEQTWQGGPVEVSWTTVEADEGLTMTPHLWGSTGGHTFTSLTTDPYAATAMRAYRAGDLDDETVEIDLGSTGFAFPFDGDVYSTFRISSNGWINFGGSFIDADYTNSAIPYDSSTDVSGMFAAYWDDLWARDGTSKVLFKLSGLPGSRVLVVEWNNFSRTDAVYTGALTFQAVLHEQGDMEARFLTVAPDAIPDDAEKDATNRDLYVGGSATIGWESQAADGGVEVLYNEPRSDLVAPGSTIHLYSTRVSSDAGSRSLNLTEDTSVELCATGSGFTTCQTRDVKVIQPGDVLVTELMIDPPGGSSGQWIEIRNLRHEPIDLGGWVLTDDLDPSDGVTEGSVTLPGGTVLQGGDMLTVGAPGVAGFTPDVVWSDPALVLEHTDGVALVYGPLTVDSVTWNGSDWALPSGTSLTLDPSWMERDPEANDLFATDDGEAVWCPSDATEVAGSPKTVGYGCRHDTYDLDRWGSHNEFIDISATGQVFEALNDRATVAQLPGGLGFPVDFYGATVQDVWISTNGWFAFMPWTDHESSGPYGGLPSSASYYPDSMVAPFWDGLDVNRDTAGRVLSSVRTQTLDTPGSRVTIVQWTDWKIWTTSAEGTITFQAQLWENGDIVFAYGPMEFRSGSDTYADDYRGGDAIVGIEDPTGTKAVEWSNDEDGAVYPGLVITFRHRP